jgi:hypothetical protein
MSVVVTLPRNLEINVVLEAKDSPGSVLPRGEAKKVTLKPDAEVPLTLYFDSKFSFKEGDKLRLEIRDTDTGEHFPGPEGITLHVARNLYHATLQLPSVVNDDPPLEFDPWGTAFWLNNGIFLFCLTALLRGGFDRRVRAAAALGLACIWFGLLLHQTNGWRQFGYRFLIDLLPIGFVLFLYGYRRFNAWMAASLAWSFAVNLYGLWAWKELPRPFLE